MNNLFIELNDIKTLQIALGITFTCLLAGIGTVLYLLWRNIR
jgi:hypothetical protein